jgi:hypothetical protein
MLKRGLELARFNESRQNRRHKTNDRRFRAHYGVGPKSLACLFNQLRGSIELLVERTAGENLEQNPAKMSVKDFLMALNFLKGYNLEEEMAGSWNYDEKTVRIKVRAYTRWIQILAEIKIRFGKY